MHSVYTRVNNPYIYANMLANKQVESNAKPKVSLKTKILNCFKNRKQPSNVALPPELANHTQGIQMGCTLVDYKTGRVDNYTTGTSYHIDRNMSSITPVFGANMGVPTMNASIVTSAQAMQQNCMDQPVNQRDYTPNINQSYYSQERDFGE